MGLSYHFVLPPTGPADAHVVREMFDDVKTYLDTFVPSGGAAPINAQYVTLATDATLTNERLLTGTANQITLTDNGAGSTVVLSLPQSIAITSSPSFASIVYRAASASKVTIKPQDPTPFADYILTLPDSDGGSGEVMKSDGNGVLSWTSIVSNISGTASQVLVSATTGSVTLSLPQNIDTSSSPTFNELLLSGGTSSADLTLKLHDSHTGFYADGLGGLTVVAGNGSNIIVGGWLSSDQSYNSVGPVKAPAFHFVDAGIGSPTVTILPPTGFTSYSLTLPVDDGTSNQVLTTNGSGVLSWTTQTGSGTVNTGTANRLAYYAASTAAVSALSAITASRALVSDSNGLPVASATTAVELGYVSGVSSAIQTQLGTKATVALDNLTSVAINTTLVSDTNNTDDLGTSSIRWKTGYLATSLDISATSNQFVLGTTRTVTFTAPTPASSSRTITFPDLSGDYSVVGTIGTQSIAGAKTLTTAPLTLTQSTTDLYILAENTNNASGTANAYLWARSGGSSGGDPYLFLNVAGVTSYSIGLDNSDSDALCICENQGMSGTNLARITTASGFQIKGTTTNDSPPAGFVGEIVSSSVSSFANAASTNTYGNITSISLTAGRWIIFGTFQFTQNGSTMTRAVAAISVNSGNTTTDHVSGLNDVDIPAVLASAGNPGTGFTYLLKLSATTTVYLKGRAVFTVGTPQFLGSIQALRHS